MSNIIHITEEREARHQKQLEKEIEEGERCLVCSNRFVREVNEDGYDVEIAYGHGEPVACKNCWTVESGLEIQDDKCFTG